jgi:hypothetical protein
MPAIATVFCNSRCCCQGGHRRLLLGRHLLGGPVRGPLRPRLLLLLLLLGGQ